MGLLRLTKSVLTVGLIVFLLPLFLGVSAHAWLVPDMGLTKCYNNTTEINSPQPGEPFYGLDAQYIGPARLYTKLGSGGIALPDSATSWLMAHDNVTGLIWEVKQNKDGVSDYSNPNDAL